AIWMPMAGSATFRAKPRSLGCPMSRLRSSPRTFPVRWTVCDSSLIRAVCDAGQLYRAPLRRLSPDRLARRDFELLPAAPVGPGSGPHEIAAAGRAGRVRAGRDRGDDA